MTETTLHQAVQTLRSQRTKHAMEEAESHTRVAALKQFIREKFHLVGVNHFTSFSNPPTFADLLEKNNISILSGPTPIQPQAQHIGTWGGGPVTETHYLNPLGEKRWAYLVVDVDIDDYQETVLITSQPLNHEQFLHLLYYQEGRDTWHGDHEQQPSLPKLIETIRSKSLKNSEGGLKYFALFAEHITPFHLALASYDPETPDTEQALLSLASQQGSREFQSLCTTLGDSYTEEQLANAGKKYRAQITRDLPLIARTAAAIRKLANPA